MVEETLNYPENGAAEKKCRIITNVVFTRKKTTVPSNEIDRVDKFDNSLSFGAKQNSLRQIFFEL